MCVCVDLCVFRPSDDLKGLLQFHNQLPIRFLHLVSEPVLQSIDGGPRDLKPANVDDHHQTFNVKRLYRK